jgi:hypothetical protein
MVVWVQFVKFDSLQLVVVELVVVVVTVEVVDVVVVVVIVVEVILICEVVDSASSKLLTCTGGKSTIPAGASPPDAIISFITTGGKSSMPPSL